MHTGSIEDYLDYLEELEDKTSAPRGGKPKGKTGKTKERAELVSKLVEKADDARQGFNPSFTSSRHEHAWIITYLGGFYEDHVISDVLRQVKGGKEATVYCCQAHPETGLDLIAAKVYRPRMFRNIRNDMQYRQGRDIVDGHGHGSWGRRQMLAMKKRTGFGQELLHVAWLGNEFSTMRMLYDAGADVPKPISHSDNAILMEYLGEERWPAPALQQVELTAAEAGTLFDRLIWNIELMMSLDRIHADLSAHNILYWDGVAKIIDFPQTVDPNFNPDARFMLGRDVERVCQYFSKYGIKADPQAIATDLWTRYTPG